MWCFPPHVEVYGRGIIRKCRVCELVSTFSPAFSDTTTPASLFHSAIYMSTTGIASHNPQSTNYR